MVIHHPRRLHEGVADGGADELEAGAGQGLAQGVGCGGFGGDFGQGRPGVLEGDAADATP